MFRRIFYSACLAGVGAGLVLTLVQSWQMVPIILAAETYESAGADSAGSAATLEAHASAALTTQLILATAAANAVFWLLLGPLRALSFQKLAKT